jgi:hypothetical protein
MSTLLLGYGPVDRLGRSWLRSDGTFRLGKVKMKGGLLFTDALHVLKLNDSGIRTS